MWKNAFDLVALPRACGPEGACPGERAGRAGVGLSEAQLARKDAQGIETRPFAAGVMSGRTCGRVWQSGWSAERWGRCQADWHICGWGLWRLSGVYSLVGQEFLFVSSYAIHLTCCIELELIQLKIL